MTRTRTSVLGATFILLAGALALTLVLLAGRSSGGNQLNIKVGASLSGPNSKEATAGEGPVGGYEAYLSASRTYPAAAIPPAVVARAKATFNRIAKRDARLAKSHGRRFLDSGGNWKQYGPQKYALQPGVTSFSGATNVTASRITALVADPDCSARSCRVWAGASGGGVWRSNNIEAPDPEWTQLSPDDLDQNSVGTLILDPSDKKHDTLYLGTGEGNRCSSGCEAGVGIYKSTDAGNHWKKLNDTCVSNGTYPCATPGKDAFLGRGINSIVIDPTEQEPHLRRLGARGSWPLARDRQRWDESWRARRERARCLRVVRRRQDVHRGLERRQCRIVRDHGRRARSAQPVGCVRGGVRQRRVAPVGARRIGHAVRLPADLRPAVSGRRDRPDDVRADGQGRTHPDLPDRRHGQRRRLSRRTSGGPTTATRLRRRCSPPRRQGRPRPRRQRLGRRPTTGGRC